MPELPEVETIRRELAPRVRGRRIVDAGAFASAKHSAAVDALGVGIVDVGRRGKYLLVDLDDDRELVIHLGMTGQLRVVDTHSADDAYLRAWWALDDGAFLEFSDVRRFGRIACVPRGDWSSLPTLRAIGPEPLTDGFDVREFHRALNGSSRAIKTQLLSQRPVAGVGNIYADEALWRARVHPLAKRITRPQAVRLHAAIREVLEAGIANNGTTLRDYRTLDGGYGSNQDSLDAYGRAGFPCARCGTPLRSAVIDARTSTWCPKCQRLPRTR